MIGDVQQILQGSEVPKDVVKKTPKPSAVRKPEGMKRELFNLIKGKDLTAVMPTDVKKTYKQKFQAIFIIIFTGFRSVRKYKWMSFTNEARTDGLMLHHWVRADKVEAMNPYPFSKFNKVIDIPTYTDEEYENHLKIAKWSRGETDYLFDTCRRFDIRWPIVFDRYDCKMFGVNRSVEDLKERFYSINYELNLLRDPSSSPTAYDAEHERRRKEQLNKQWNRTAEQLQEEEDLTAELRRIELRKKEREKKAHDLQKLINMTEQPASPSTAGFPGAATAKRKNQFRVKGGSISMAVGPLFNPLDISVTALRFSEFKSSGAHFRGQEMKLPTNIGQKKLKNIEVILEKCKMEMNPVASESIMKTYNDFRSQVMLVQELKSAMQTAEYELESVRTKMQEHGKDFEIDPRFRISQLPEGGLDEDLVGGPGQAATSRRITSYIDTSGTKDAATIQSAAARKRKATATTPTLTSTPSSSSLADPKRPRKV
ncbi:CRE-EKL-4 protein [Caenorhabditis remanei]|uniref:DNA methyltransferase 1-associated protein 1 n=1 Tax=Caenorhabditis remanei TaxID=31234 RepID=E3N1Q1_CAERE|nr:CRE-EKL-4 protein [Caenorhabditis remanei]